jgi:hypothetical protein
MRFKRSRNARKAVGSTKSRKRTRVTWEFVGESKRGTVRRIRSLVWLAGVVARSRCDFNYLQNEYVTCERTTIDKSRTFLRIEQEGDDPDSMKTLIRGECDNKYKGLTLAERVARTQDLIPTLDTHRSVLWRLLSSPRLEPPQLAMTINRLLSGLSLSRDSAMASHLLENKHGDALPYNEMAKVYRQSLDWIAQKGDADHLALLVSLYLEADYSKSYDLLDELRLAVIRGTVVFLNNNMIRGMAHMLFTALIYQRIAGNDWGEMATQVDLDAAKLAIKKNMIRLHKADKRKGKRLRTDRGVFAMEKVAILRPKLEYPRIRFPIIPVRNRHNSVREERSVMLTEKQRRVQLVKTAGRRIVRYDREITDSVMGHIYFEGRIEPYLGANQ